MSLNNEPTLGVVIRAARKRRRITLRAFARTMDISPSLLSLIEHDEHVPPSELIARMAKVAGEDPDLWCGLVGKLTPATQSSLSRLGRTDPVFLRNIVERFGGSR